MNPPSSRSHPLPWSRYLVALGVVPSLALAAFGFYALRREEALSKVDAQAQASTLAQAAADSIANAAFALPFPSAADVDAWIAHPGSPDSEPLSRIQNLQPGVIARLVTPQGTYPPLPRRSTSVPSPDPGSPLAEQWSRAVRTEATPRPSATAASTWQSTLDLAQGHPAEPIARFRFGAALGRLGRNGEARTQLESLITPPAVLAGETGLPLDVLAYRALLQIAETDPQASQPARSWYNGLAQRVLLHWQLPEALLLDATAPSEPSLKPWQDLAKLHDQSRQAFLQTPTTIEPGAPSWSTNPPNGVYLTTSHPVEGGVWQVVWPERTLQQALSTTGSVLLPGYLGRIVHLAGRQFPGASTSEPLATATASIFPALSVTLTLAHPEILDARQRRKTWIFATLITLATLATLAGYFAALRASERQRQLALQQSEFVAGSQPGRGARFTVELPLEAKHP